AERKSRWPRRNATRCANAWVLAKFVKQRSERDREARPSRAAHCTRGRRARPVGAYPADTEIIANVVTSPHHLGATMVTNRSHRMTELFGRLAPEVSLDAARAELTAAHDAMMRAHPEAYSARANVQLRVAQLRDQIAAPART